MTRNLGGEDQPRHFEVVIVGAGMAGLTAAHRLRGRNVVVLEAEDRTGGRVLSRADGPLWLNWGAHMLGGPGTAVGALIEEFALPTRPIAGRLFAMVHQKRTLLRTPSWLYPFAFALSPRERVALAKMGLALRSGAARFVAEATARPGENEAARRQRLRSFEAERSLSDYVGPLPPKVARILRCITERTGADPEEMAAGHGLRSFANVWAKSAPSHNLIGGSSRLPEAIAASLGAAVRTGWRVCALKRTDEAVEVVVQTRGGTTTLYAQTVILAVPGLAARALLPDAPALREALEAQHCGPFLSAAVRLRPAAKMPLSANYAVATPGRSFSAIINLATALPHDAGAGGTLMLFRGARGARELMRREDHEIASAFRTDLAAIAPEIEGLAEEIIIARWPCGAPFLPPGAAASQRALDEGAPRIVIAGDHLEAPNLEAAVRSGEEAAQAVRRFLDAPKTEAPRIT